MDCEYLKHAKDEAKRVLNRPPKLLSHFTQPCKNTDCPLKAMAICERSSVQSFDWNHPFRTVLNELKQMCYFIVDEMIMSRRISTYVKTSDGQPQKGSCGVVFRNNQEI